MGTLLKWVGVIWALLGVANLVGMPWTTGTQTLLGFGLMFNILLFVLPGLVVYGIGAAIAKKKAAPAQEPSARPVGARLSELTGLREKGLISPDEFEASKAKILQEV